MSTDDRLTMILFQQEQNDKRARERAMEHDNPPPTIARLKDLQDFTLLRAIGALIGCVPRVHGNGFIQLDISPTLRLNVWADDRIPRQKVNTPIHNHQFSFTSVVLRGVLRNVLYNEYSAAGLVADTHEKFTAIARTGEDTTLQPTRDICSLAVSSVKTYGSGQAYSMLVGQIHESLPMAKPTVTLMSKTPGNGVVPTVYIPTGVKPDNEFNKYGHDANALWKIIEDALS